MNLVKYDYKTDPTYTSFTFQSVGPKGTIEKVVNYQTIRGFVFTDGRQVINLGFGDWDAENKKVDDSTISNNNDRDKVLATVAATVLEFTDRHGHLPIFAQGSSAARTRLYQMGINANRSEVEKLFIVLGLADGKWLKFDAGINFEAFLVIRK
jgi:hypothetical protein